MGRDDPFQLLAAGEENRFQIEVPAASPLFSGHFPGHPIFPGIAYLGIVARALGAPLAAVRGVRLRRQVTPGETLDLLLTPGTDGWTRFEIRCGGEAVGGGAVAAEWGGGEDRTDRSDRSDPSDGVEIPEAGGFPLGLPHAPPARLIHGVIEAEAERIVCSAVIPADHPLAAGERFPAFLAVEAAAQGAAALEALARTGNSAPRIGYLVGIREARFAVPTLPVGRPFRVSARLAGSAPPLSIYEVAAGEVMTGTISTYITGDAG